MVSVHRPSNVSLVFYSFGIAIPHAISGVEMPSYAHQIILAVSNVFLLCGLILARKKETTDKPNEPIDLELVNPTNSPIQQFIPPPTFYGGIPNQSEPFAVNVIPAGIEVVTQPASVVNNQNK